MTGRYRAAPALLALLLVLLFTGWVYWPGQTGPALLDDQSSVMVIADLQAQPELAWDYITGDKSGPLGRPVSMVSFVLEKLYLDGGLAGSKRINIALHLLNGALVVWLYWLLFGHISVPAYRWLALALGAVWLLSPLLVSTVLYVVQRMAILSTGFMLLATISYIYWRSALARGQFAGWLLLCLLLNFALALFAKENAIVLVPVLLLMEALWFQFRDQQGQTIAWLQRVTIGLIVLGGTGLLAVLVVEYDSLAGALQHRYFTLDERLLTEARIVWDYVGQIYAPDVLTMGLYHDDYVVSVSLDQPPSTRYAVFAWLGVAVLSLVLLAWQWGRYLALGILWFLVGHSVESTVLSLELYFEHRNYYPAIGLLLLPGVVFALLVRCWRQITRPLLVYLGCYALWLASLTGSQVQIWSSQPLLILSHLNGHPDSFRANADMAVQMANVGEFAAARHYSRQAFEVDVAGERAGDFNVRDLALACIAHQEVSRARIDELGRVNPARPFSSVATLLTLVRLLQDGTCPGFDRVYFADRMADIFLAEGAVATASPKIYSSLAVLENVLQRWDNASAYISKFLDQAPDNANALLMKLHFVSALGKVDAANAIKSRLLQLQGQGKLTVGEQQTLSLYLEN